MLENPVIIDLAASVSRTPAQVILRWHLQQGTIVIPKSVTTSRIIENLAVFDFSLDTAAVSAINTLDTSDGSGRVGSHPNEAD